MATRSAALDAMTVRGEDPVKAAVAD